MTDILALLAAYYACDAVTTSRMLTVHEAQICAAAYDSVKVQFLTEEEAQALMGLGYADRARALLTGYHRFKAWEGQNPEQVTALRRELLLARD